LTDLPSCTQDILISLRLEANADMVLKCQAAGLIKKKCVLVGYPEKLNVAKFEPSGSVICRGIVTEPYHNLVRFRARDSSTLFQARVKAEI
jgi:hypothetical protein